MIRVYSPNVKAHTQLLPQFASLTEQHMIMLSARKMIVGQPKIEFLGMKLFQGQYQAQPNIVQELLKFPDEQLTGVQIQQLLSIINYLRDFIPYVLKLTRPLSTMLRKDAPTWLHAQTEAVKQLKKVMQDLPPLQIPTDRKRIL